MAAKAWRALRALEPPVPVLALKDAVDENVLSAHAVHDAVGAATDAVEAHAVGVGVEQLDVKALRPRLLGEGLEGLPQAAALAPGRRVPHGAGRPFLFPS